MDINEKSESSSVTSSKSTSSEDGDIYEVERIMGMSKTKGKILYKVRWQGYDENWDTWEPVENLSACLNLIDDFITQKKKSKKPEVKPLKVSNDIQKLDKEVFSQEESSQDTILGSESPSAASTSSQKSVDRKRSTWVYVSDEEADTLKDKFWRDLDQGKVDVFGNDMYSKVKGEGTRTSRPESFKEMFKNKPLVQTADMPGTIKKKRTSLDRRSIESQKSTDSQVSVDGEKTSKGSTKAKKVKEKSKIKKKISPSEVKSIEHSVSKQLLVDEKLASFPTEVKSIEHSVSKQLLVDEKLDSIPTEVKSEPVDSFTEEKTNVKGDNSSDEAAKPQTSLKLLPDGTVDTLKDTFFRDLEEGKINLFEGEDMYSKVKAGGGRAARPQSFSEMFKTQPLVKTETPVSCTKEKKKRKSTDLEQKGSKASSGAKVKCETPINSSFTETNITVGYGDSDMESCVSSVSTNSGNSGIPKLKIQISRKKEGKDKKESSSTQFANSGPPLLTSEYADTGNETKGELSMDGKHEHSVKPRLPTTVEAKAKKKKKKKSTDLNLAKEENIPSNTKDMVGVVGKYKKLHVQWEDPKFNKCRVVVTRLPHTVVQQISVTLHDGKLESSASKVQDTIIQTCPVEKHPIQDKILDTNDRDDLLKEKVSPVKNKKCAIGKSPVSFSSGAEDKSLDTNIRKTNKHGSTVVVSSQDVNISEAESINIKQNNTIDSGLMRSTDVQVSCISFDISDGKQQHRSSAVSNSPRKGKSTVTGKEHGQENRKRKLTEKERDSLASDSPKKGKHGCEKPAQNSPPATVSQHQLSTLDVEEFNVDFGNTLSEQGEYSSSSSPLTSHEQLQQHQHCQKAEPVMENVVELINSSHVVEEVSSLGSPQHGPHSNYSVQSCDSGVDISHEKSFLTECKESTVTEPGSPMKVLPFKVIDEDKKSFSSLTFSSVDQGEKQLDFIDFDLAEIEPSIHFNTLTPKIDPYVELTTNEFRHAVKKNEFSKVKAALNRRKYDLEQPDLNGVSLVMICALHGFDDMLELLVRYGANINAETKSGVTALMMSCEQGLRCTTELLLALGAYMNRTTANSGETALVKCIKRGHIHTVKSLLNYGCNFNSTSCNEHGALKYATTYNRQEIKDLIETHIERVTLEFGSQVKLTLNNTAKIHTALFPIQCLSLRESDKFRITFRHELQPTKQGIGMLLFIAHARVSGTEAKCRFYGPCAVTSAILNGTKLHALTEEGNFVMSFCPLHNGRNELEIFTVAAPSSRAKLIVCAYQAQLVAR